MQSTGLVMTSKGTQRLTKVIFWGTRPIMIVGTRVHPNLGPDENPAIGHFCLETLVSHSFWFSKNSTCPLLYSSLFSLLDKKQSKWKPCR